LAPRDACAGRDLKNLETHLLDTGHSALETHGEEIASRIKAFLAKNKISSKNLRLVSFISIYAI
jgi:predicted ATPase